MNRYVLRCLDSEPNSISSNFQDCDFDVVGQDDLLVFLTTNNQHQPLPLVEVLLILRRNTGREKYTRFFLFKHFNFVGLSGTLVAF